MKKKIRITMIIALLAILGASLIINSSNLAKSEGNTPTNLPPGNWSLSAGPYQGDGYKMRDVVVTSVTTDTRKGLTITKVGLKNRSGKPVSSLKLHWVLFTEEDRNSVLAEGDTPLIPLSEDIPVDGKRIMEYPVVSFLNISRSLQTDGILSGSFRLEVLVTEIQGDEMSAVQRGHDFAKSFTDGRVYGKISAAPKAVYLQTCAKQKCKFITGPMGDGYTCETSTNDEYCTNNSTSCTSTLCGMAD